MQKILFILLVLPLVLLHATVEFTNVQCASLDKEFAGFEYCFLKSVNRSYKYLSVKTNFYKLPLTNVTVNINFMKKANGYKPFLYNITFDGCKHLASSKKNPVIQYFHELIYDYTNLNHSCPIDHDAMVEKLPVSHVNNMFTNILPMPHGEYALFIRWYAYNAAFATVNVYLKLF